MIEFSWSIIKHRCDLHEFEKSNPSEIYKDWKRWNRLTSVVRMALALNNKTFISREQYSSHILSYYVVYMEIIIRHNGVYFKNANLGKGFSDLIADLTVDSYGRVKVKTKSKLSFYIDPDHPPTGILGAIDKRLEKKASNRLASLKSRRQTSSSNWLS